MKNLSLVAVIFIGALTGIARAQSEPITVAGSVKVNQSRTCDIASNCPGSETAAVSGMQAFAITPDQEARIDQNTTVTLNIFGSVIVSFRIGDDPSYQPGDKSASLTVLSDVIGSPVNMQVKVSWAKGVMIVRAKGKGSRQITAPPTMPLLNSLHPASAPSALPPPNPLGTYPMTTTVLDEVDTFAVSTGFVACQVMQNVKATPGPNSVMKAIIAVSIKSKYQVAEPL